MVQINGTSNTAEAFRYFYHPDHLGSTSYVTDASGEVFQHLEYFAFGETFVEEHSNTDRVAYLFNAKELDEETGLYYYGARYYDPRASIWQSVDRKAETYPGLSPFVYAGNNPVLFVDYDGNDFGVTVDRARNTITISAHYITNRTNAGAFNTYGRDRWNAQSGRYVFVAGTIKDLKRGRAQAFTVNINITSQVVDGPVVNNSSPGDAMVRNDRTGTLNSFDSVNEFPRNDRQRGGTGNDEITMTERDKNTGATTHETSHSLGNGHTTEGGSLDIYNGEQVGKSNVAETLNGVGIGGDTSQRNANSSVGDGTMLNGSTNQGLESGKMISANRYNRIMNRLNRHAERNADQQ